MSAISVILIFLIRLCFTMEIPKKQIEIVLAMSNHFSTKQCIFVEFGGIFIMKEMSNANIFSTVTTILKFEKLSRTISSSFSNRILVVELKTDENNSFANVSSPTLFCRLILDESSGNEAKKLPSIPEAREIYLARYDSNGFWVREISVDKPIFERFRSTNASLLEIQKERAVNDFLGITLVVATNFLNCDSIKAVRLFPKVHCLHDNLVKLMSVRLNFTINWIKIRPLDAQKVLLSKQVNFTIFIYAIESKNFTDWDFVFPTYFLTFHMFMKRKQFKDKWNSYLEPFQPKVWYATIVIIAVSGLSFFTIDHLNLKYCKRQKGSVGLSKYFLTAFGIFCSQAGTECNDSFSSRIYRIFVLLLAVCLYSVYNGSLLFSLAFYNPGIPFNDLDGLFSDGNHKVTAINHTYIYFQESFALQKNIRIGDFLVESDKLPKTEQEGFDFICENQYLTYLTIKENLFQINRLKCEVVEIPCPAIVRPLGFGLPKNSPFREYFSRELIHVRSTGMLKGIYKHLDLRHFSGSSSIENDSGFSADIWTVLPVVMVFGLGVFASFCIFLGEMMLMFSTSMGTMLVHKSLRPFKGDV